MTAAAQPSATGVPAYTQVLPRLPQSVRRARSLVEITLAAWHLPELTFEADLVVTELIANAAAHAVGPTISVTITRCGPRRVRVAVVDQDEAAVPTPRSAGAWDEHGRGLALIEATSRRWGTERLPGAKRVWAELEAEP